MNEQIEKLIDDTDLALERLEEEVFKTHRENYIAKKNIIEDYHNELIRLRRILHEGLTPQMIESIQASLREINADIQKGCIFHKEKDGQTFQELMDDLNEDKVETVLPKEKVDETLINHAIEDLASPLPQENGVTQVPSIEEIEIPKTNEIEIPQMNTPVVEAADISDDVDLTVLDSILDTQDSGSTGSDAFRI